jgi:hypothetical protein
MDSNLSTEMATRVKTLPLNKLIYGELPVYWNGQRVKTLPMNKLIYRELPVPVYWNGNKSENTANE